MRLHFGLAFRRDAMLSRCAACNGRVRVRVTPADLDADAPRCRGVPAHVRAACAEFWACDACDKARAAAARQPECPARFCI